MRLRILSVLLLAAVGCSRAPAPSNAAETPSTSKIRPATVAGLFYPAEADTLRRDIDQYLAQAKAESLGKIRGLVCPHAGYKYSGSVAASSYKQVQGQPFSTVIVLAPSHYAAFRGAVVGDADALATPLGNLAVAPLARELAKRPAFAVDPDCRVMRPDWADQTPVQPTGPDTPLTWEHALEVQLPFIQRVLPQASVVPAVLGRSDPAAIAQALADVLDDRTLVVASSDLSHYLPYDEARRRDAACVQAICALDVTKIDPDDACGHAPVLALMHLARQQGWKTRRLDLRNSGDTAGDRSRVVGYAAVAFYDDRPASGAAEYSLAARKFLLELAREAVAKAARHEPLPQIKLGDAPEAVRVPRACFVTLTKRGELRGCIGSLTPQEPLGEAVVRRASDAALHDPRFPPVTLAELAEVKIEISVLTLPKPLEFAAPDDLLKKLRPHVDGVVLHVDGAQATFLPQVWEQLPQAEAFLSHLSRKAGRAPNAWRNPGTRVETYQVEAFAEDTRK